MGKAKYAVLALAAAILAACYLPDAFKSEVRVGNTGDYSISFYGDLIWAPLYWMDALLRCLAALARAADAIGETDEATRCWTFLQDSSAEASEALKG